MYKINLQLFAIMATAEGGSSTNATAALKRYLDAMKQYEPELNQANGASLTENAIKNAVSNTGAIGELKQTVTPDTWGSVLSPLYGNDLNAANSAIDAAGKAATDKAATDALAAKLASSQGEDKAPALSPVSIGVTSVSPINIPTQTPAPTLPAYSGMSTEALRKALLESASAGVNASADSQLSIIKQNLANALSNLEAEKATGQSNLDKQIKDIGDNQFASTELTKERMNQGGWDMNNSGLAVGEVDRIGIGADKSKADANGNLAQILNDIARRSTLAKTNADTGVAGVEKVRGDQLAGAEADALLNAENTAYGRYRDTVADSQWSANFSETQKQNAFSNMMAQNNYDLNKTQAEFNMKLSQAGFNQQQTEFEWNKQVTTANLTGKMQDGSLTLDGKRYSAEEAQTLKNDAWNRVNSTGVVDAASAKILGIPEGTSTLEAKKFKLDSDLAVAGVTGVYNGQPTLAGKQFNWDTNLKDNPQNASAIESLKEQKAQFSEWTKTAPQRLALLDSQVKAAKTAEDFAILQKIAEQQTIDLNKINLKYAPIEAQAKINESKASIDNIKSEIQNRLVQQKIDQQNANTSSSNAATNAAQLAWSKDPTNPDNIYKAAQAAGKDSDYSSMLEIGMKMKGSTLKDVTGADNLQYTNDQLASWVKGLNLTAAEKARLANTMGIPAPTTIDTDSILNGLNNSIFK